MGFSGLIVFTLFERVPRKKKKCSIPLDVATNHYSWPARFYPISHLLATEHACVSRYHR